MCSSGLHSLPPEQKTPFLGKRAPGRLFTDHLARVFHSDWLAIRLTYRDRVQCPETYPGAGSVDAAVLAFVLDNRGRFEQEMKRFNRWECAAKFSVEGFHGDDPPP